MEGRAHHAKWIQGEVVSQTQEQNAAGIVVPKYVVKEDGSGMLHKPEISLCRVVDELQENAEQIFE